MSDDRPMFLIPAVHAPVGTLSKCIKSGTDFVKVEKLYQFESKTDT